MTDQTSQARHAPHRSIVLGVALFVLLVPLLLYAYTGFYARFVQDDYCYAVHLRANGLAGSWLHAYLNATPFSGNRYALTFFLDLSQGMGAAAAPTLPALMIALWLTGLYLTLRELNAALGWQLSALECALPAAGIAAFTLSQAPNLTQVLYWRPGMFPYLAPVVALSGLLAWMSARLRRGVSVGALIGMVAAALIAGGFSETAATFMGGLFGLLLLAAFAGLRQGKAWAQAGFRMAWAGLLGSLLAALALILSPAARLRQAALFPEPPGAAQVLAISLESARFFIVHTLYRVTLPTLAVGGLAFCAAVYIYTHRATLPPLPVGRLLLRGLAALAGGYLLLVCVAAPIAYAESTYPEGRVLLMARLVVVAVVGLLGWWGGQALASWRSAKLLQRFFPLLVAPVAAVYAFGLLGVQPGARIEPPYPELRAYLFAHPGQVLAALAAGLAVGAVLSWRNVRSASPTLAAALLAAVFLLQPLFAAGNALYDLPDFQLRGRMWDYRDAQIRALAAQGQRTVQVRALDSLAGITELQANPTHWVNNCAAAYYGVDSITAVEPILNPPVHPQE